MYNTIYINDDIYGYGEGAELTAEPPSVGAVMIVTLNAVTIDNGETTPVLIGVANQGGDPVQKTFVIENIGDEDLNVISVSADNPQYSFPGFVPVTIPAGGNSNLVVELSPDILGTFNATLCVSSDAPTSYYLTEQTGLGGPIGIILTEEGDEYLTEQAVTGNPGEYCFAITGTVLIEQDSTYMRTIIPGNPIISKGSGVVNPGTGKIVLSAWNISCSDTGDENLGRCEVTIDEFSNVRNDKFQSQKRRG